MTDKKKNYDVIMTEDGSETLFSHLYGEACHSTSGARAETDTHYIQGCEIVARSKRSNLFRILEMGFGTGIGFEQTKRALTDIPFHFTSLEIDADLVKRYADLKHITFEWPQPNQAIFQDENYTLEILVGNARENIKNLTESYDAIYQDAFSPKRNAELWTVEWFRDLYALASYQCIMSTYSSSSSIRKSMIEAGWKVYKGVKFGPKRSSTRAKTTGSSDEDILEQLERSPAPIITDENYKAYQNGELN